MKIVECVPNFSEGRDRPKIDKIAGEISSIPHVRLLDVDPGHDANRTVMTFAGEIDAVGEAAFSAIKKAAEVTDMRLHRGSHPRIGATDVCPFVPVSGVTMEECVDLSRRVGRRVGEELGIPVYLYEESASADYRRRLADIRKGEYEGLAEKIREERWKPDFGPALLDERAGATVIGARWFLIAFNVNLNSTSVAHARKIAARVRERKEGGGLQAVRAIGWEVPRYGCVQVSMNLVNYNVTPLHAAFEETRRIAREMGLRVTGSEIVGLVPMEALLLAGRYYLHRQGRCAGLPHDEVLRCALRSLGLEDVAPFDPDAKILERKLFPRPLIDVSVAAFIDSLSSDRPSPGGGSAAALSGSAGAGLVAMVSATGFRKKKEQDAREALERAAIRSHDLKERFLHLARRDEAAYSEVVSVGALPSGTEEEMRAREARRAAAFVECIEAPLEMVEASSDALEVLKSIARDCPAAAASDAAAALGSLRSCADAARCVVEVNLKESGILPPGYAAKARERLKKAGGEIEAACAVIEAEIRKLMGGAA